jgi:hypothetical protein
MTDRELAIFTTFADTVVAPEPDLPAIDRTDAARALESWLDQAPKLNAAGVRAAITALDLAPLALGFRKRLRNLDKAQRARYLQALEASPRAPIRQATKALKGIAFLTYYGDDEIMRTLGYDADANIARAKRLRAAEGRP